MKLLYVITSTDVGGAEKALESVVRVVGQGNTVRVVCLKPLGPLAADIRSSGAQVVSLNMTGAGVGIVSKLAREIESFQPDVVHAMLFRAIEFARLACAGRKVKLITTPHFDLSQKPFWMRLLDRTLKSTDTLSCAESISTYNFLLQKQGYAKAKTVLVENAVEKSLFFKDNFVKSRMRKEKQISDSQVAFICVGRLAKIKNPQTLLRAFLKIVPNCPNAILIYVGEGPERAALEKWIKEHDLSNKVILAGAQQNINDWLNLADVFVLLSKEESLPLALLEAQQVGLPCIVSRVGDMPRQIEHGKNGFVCNPQDEILASCLMTELYSNSKLRQEMGEYSLQKSRQKQDANSKYQQIYQQVVSN